MFEGDATGGELLLAAVDALLDEVPATLPPTAALGRLARMLQARERLQAAMLTAVRDLDVRELYALDGAGSARGWLRAQPGGEDGQLVLARSLAQRQQVMCALSEGRLGARAAGQLCTALDKVPATVDDDVISAVLLDGIGQLLTAAEGGTPESEIPPALLAARVEAEQVLQDCADATTTAPADRLEPALVLLATRLTPNLLATALRSLIDPLLPDGSDGDPNADPYYLELRPLYDGDWDLRGLLDPETGQSLKAELDRRRSTADITTDRRPARDVLGLLGDPDNAADAAAPCAPDGDPPAPSAPAPAPSPTTSSPGGRATAPSYATSSPSASTATATSTTATAPCAYATTAGSTNTAGPNDQTPHSPPSRPASTHPARPTERADGAHRSRTVTALAGRVTLRGPSSMTGADRRQGRPAGNGSQQSHGPHRGCQGYRTEGTPCPSSLWHSPSSAPPA